MDIPLVYIEQELKRQRVQYKAERNLAHGVSLSIYKKGYKGRDGRQVPGSWGEAIPSNRERDGQGISFRSDWIAEALKEAAVTVSKEFREEYLDWLRAEPAPGDHRPPGEDPPREGLHDPAVGEPPGHEPAGEHPGHEEPHEGRHERPHEGPPRIGKGRTKKKPPASHGS